MLASSPTPQEAYDTRAAWRFVRSIETWVLAAERFRIKMGRVAQVFETGTWEEKDAMKVLITQAVRDMEQAQPLIEGDANLDEALTRAIHEAAAAHAWAVAKRLEELLGVIKIESKSWQTIKWPPSGATQYAPNPKTD